MTTIYFHDERFDEVLATAHGLGYERDRLTLTTNDATVPLWSVDVDDETAKIIAREVDGGVFQRDPSGDLVPATRARGASPAERAADLDRKLGAEILDVLRDWHRRHLATDDGGETTYYTGSGADHAAFLYQLLDAATKPTTEASDGDGSNEQRFVLWRHQRGYGAARMAWGTRAEMEAGAENLRNNGHEPDRVLVAPEGVEVFVRYDREAWDRGEYATCRVWLEAAQS